MTGITFSLLAGMGFAASAVFARIGLQNISTTSGTLFSLIVSTIGAFGLALLLDPSNILVPSGVSLAWLFFTGLLNFPLGRLFNFAGVRLAGVSKASTIVATSPLFATGLAIILLDESINFSILIGTFAIMGGMILILYRE